MNPDKITTYAGALGAVAIAVAAYQMPEGMPDWLRIVGYVAAAATALHGYYTNKGMKK